MYSTKCHFFSSVARHGDTVTDDTLTLLLSRIPNADEGTLAPFVSFWEGFYNFCLHFKAVCNFLRTYFTAFDWKFARIPQVFLSIAIQSFSGTRAKDPLRSPLKFFLGLLQNLFFRFFWFPVILVPFIKKHLSLFTFNSDHCAVHYLHYELSEAWPRRETMHLNSVTESHGGPRIPSRRDQRHLPYYFGHFEIRKSQFRPHHKHGRYWRLFHRQWLR